MRLLHVSCARRARLFDGCQAAVIWLAVLASIVTDPAVLMLALAAMAAVAIAAAFVALCPAAPAAPSQAAFPATRED